ncbi:MAG: PadR family transcriptional regulator, partial [Chloroflexota bacterium]|nr:PadR family transcriptional regulator [Chloroflexota bacterium]
MSPTRALLGLLFHNERHGYELKRIVDQEFAPFWRIDFAQLYRSLAKMQRAGWVKARRERGAGGPDRKVYAITAAGRKALNTWLADPAADHAEVLVKLRLAADAGASVTRVVEQHRRVLENERAARSQTHQTARDAGSAGRLVLARAALRETENSLAALDLFDATPDSHGIAATPTLPTRAVITGSDDPLLARLAQLARTS